MGRVDWGLLAAGDAAVVGPFNTLFADLEAETADIGAENLRVGGLDRRSFAEYAARQTWFVADDDTVSATHTSYTLQQVGSPATDLELDFTSLIGGAGLELAASDWLHVRASIQWANGTSGGGIPYDRWMTLAIGVDEGSGYLQFSPRNRGHQALATGAMFVSHGTRYATQGARTVERVGLFSKINGGAGTFYGRCGALVATVYRRVG